MMELMSTFTAGFEYVVTSAMRKFLPGAEIIGLYSGLVHYRHRGKKEDMEAVPIFNNSFLVFSLFKGGNLNFPAMAGILDGAGKRVAESAFPPKTFRVRFSKHNRFEKVNRATVEKAEKLIKASTRLAVNRLNPDTEFWYVIRSEGVGFVGQLLTKRAATEKNLSQGELRRNWPF